MTQPCLSANRRRLYWDRRDLTRRLCAVLEFAEQVVKVLAPQGYQDAADAASGVTAEKVVAETALLLVACRSVASTDEQVRSGLARVAHLLVPYAQNERVVHGLCLNPSLAYEYAFAHVCLKHVGYPDPRFDHLLTESVNGGKENGPERLPHRMLEQHWLSRLWKPLAPQDRAERVLLKQSSLAKPLNVCVASRDDIYAFTHALMYHTDLGGRVANLPCPTRMVLASAEAAVARCLDEQDYDLCGEVLLTWPYLRRSWGPTATFAFQVLARVEDEVGFLPAPLTRIDHYRTLEGKVQTQYMLATIYHTVYVMGLLCAAVLQPPQTPPVLVLPRRATGIASILLSFLDDQDGNPPHWRADFEQLPRRTQDTLAPMLLTIALRRAVKHADLYLVRRLLETAVHYKLVDQVAIRQAAGMLSRTAAASQLLKACQAQDVTQIG